MKRGVPSAAQARLIARVFSGEFLPNVGDGYVDPTTAACIKRGWFVLSGATGTYPNGAPYSVYTLSNDGTDALEDFLRQKRYARSKPITAA